MSEPGLGHNQPPEGLDAPATLQARLAQDHADLVARIAGLEKLADEAPEEVTTEEQFKPLSDLLKAGRVALSASEAARKIENEESRRITKMIDAWFKNPAEKLAAKLAAVKERTDAYLDEKKAAEERRRIAEAERKAAEAEEKRLDALWAEARAELADYDARKASEAARAARIKKEAEARRADHLRDRMRRLRQVEPYLARRAQRRRKAEEAEAARIADLIERERAATEAREREAQAKAVRKLQLENVDRLAAEAKAAASAARKEETSSVRAAGRHADAADDHMERADRLGGLADRAEKRADKAERRASASPADMSRTRSEMGAVSSLSKSWKVMSINRSELDLNLLRGFIHPDAVEVAVRGYMLAHKNDQGGPKLAGAVFEQVEEGVYR